MKTQEQEERIESFFLAETTNYLYLLFDEHNFIHQSNGSVDQQIKATQSSNEDLNDEEDVEKTFTGAYTCKERPFQKRFSVLGASEETP